MAESNLEHPDHRFPLLTRWRIVGRFLVVSGGRGAFGVVSNPAAFRGVRMGRVAASADPSTYAAILVARRATTSIVS